MRFPYLPIEYCSEELLVKVGAKIGEPIKVDRNTSLVTRGHYARLCVEVDITKPLLSKFKLIRRVRYVEYEALHTVFFSCSKFGHTKDNYSSSLMEPPPLVEDERLVPAQTVSHFVAKIRM